MCFSRPDIVFNLETVFFTTHISHNVFHAYYAKLQSLQKKTDAILRSI